MKQLLLIAVLAFFMFSCGEEGVGFNVKKEFPLELPIDLPVGSSKLVADALNAAGDPEPFTESDTYNLDKVEAFDMGSLDSVIVNSIKYELTGIENDEAFRVQTISIELFKNDVSIGEFNLTDELPEDSENPDQYFLANIPQSEIVGLDLDELASVLQEGGDITSTVTFDFGEFPDKDIDFDFTFYFDVLAKLRDL